MADEELKQTAGEGAEEEEITPVDKDDSEPLRTHLLINQAFVGTIEELREGSCRLRLVCTEEMAVDKRGLIHTGFLFAAADYAAKAAINRPNQALAVARANFLAPVGVDDEVIFEAQVQQLSSRKRMVQVKGLLDNIKVYEGEFAIVVLERHLLNLKLT